MSIGVKDTELNISLSAICDRLSEPINDGVYDDAHERASGITSRQIMAVIDWISGLIPDQVNHWAKHSGDATYVETLKADLNHAQERLVALQRWIIALTNERDKWRDAYTDIVSSIKTLTEDTDAQ